MGKQSGSGSGTQTVNQVREMPAWAQPYAENLLQSGMSTIGQPVQQYAGMRVAPLNQDQQAAMSMIAGRALTGSPDETAGRQQATATAQGNYLNSNPWLGAPYTQQAINANAQSMGQGYALGTAAQLDAAAARARALGGTGYQSQLQQNQLALGNAIGQMANQYQLGRTGMGVQDWQQERNNMLQSIPLAFQGSQMDYNNAQQLMNVGSQNRTYQQQMLDQMYSDYLTAVNQPFQQIDRAGSLLNMAVGNSGQTTQVAQQQQSPFQQASQLAGLGLGAYGLYGALGGG